MEARYDVVVIGGGIHGVGVAQAAAAAGYTTMLLEKHALAAGTSSRSSKLIHGGLRYLEGAHYGLVRESLRERELLLRLAPALVQRVPFYLPIYRDSRRPPWMIRAGLSLYSLLGGLGRATRFESLPRREWDDLDGLETRGLRALFRYYDAQTDDARMTAAVMRSAEALGAQLRCPAEFVRATRRAGVFEVNYRVDRTQHSCRAETLVNAAGPWVNTVLDRIDPRPLKLAIELVQGAHIVVEGAIRQGVYYVEAPTDGRAVFVMPWQERTLIGTTETPYTDEPDSVQARPEEIAYLQATHRHYFPRHTGRLLESFAGLRVLPRARGTVFHRSRETVLHPDDGAPPRLITIYGGKLTGFRATAAKVLRVLRRALPARAPIADTTQLPLTP